MTPAPNPIVDILTQVRSLVEHGEGLLRAFSLAECEKNDHFYAINALAMFTDSFGKTVDHLNWNEAPASRKGDILAALDRAKKRTEAGDFP